jgi:hypothetical protein
MATPDEYDRRAAAWLRNRVPGANPMVGSVEFTTDCAAYASGGWARVDVTWTEPSGSRLLSGEPLPGEHKHTTLIDDAWEADLTTIIRELLATDPEP